MNYPALGAEKCICPRIIQYFAQESALTDELPSNVRRKVHLPRITQYCAQESAFIHELPSVARRQALLLANYPALRKGKSISTNYPVVRTG